MTLHIGVVACSAEGAALCYRTLCDEGASILGPHMHPEVSLHNHPLGEYMRHIRADAWDRVGLLMRSSAEKLAATGAELLICPDNTLHQAFDRASDGMDVPWLHIGEEVARVAHGHGYTNLGVLGTRYLMIGPVYADVLKREGLGCTIPEDKDRDLLDQVIFDELVYGEFVEVSRLYVSRMIRRLAERGCDAVVLGCTEIPLLIAPEDSPLPTLDSTRILARAALARATEGVPTIAESIAEGESFDDDEDSLDESL